MTSTPNTVKCPACGAELPDKTQQCPVCGQALPTQKVPWYKSMTPTEIFLAVLGGIMLLIGVVAL